MAGDVSAVVGEQKRDHCCDIDALDDTALKALQNSAERINARIDDLRHNVSHDATASTDSSAENLKQ